MRGASDAPAAKVEPLKLSAAQQQAQSELDAQQQKTIALEEMSLQYGALQAKTARTPAEEAQLKNMGATLQQGVTEILTYFNNTIAAELETRPAAGKNAPSASENAGPSYLQSTLGKAGAARPRHPHPAGREPCLRDCGHR